MTWLLVVGAALITIAMVMLFAKKFRNSSLDLFAALLALTGVGLVLLWSIQL